MALLCASAIWVLVLTPTSVWAHAYLVKSIPARRAILFEAPARIQLWFNERLEPRFSSVSVTNADGKPVDLNDARVPANEPKQLSVGLRALSLGVYIVKFRVLSVDGHVAQSEFPF